MALPIVSRCVRPVEDTLIRECVTDLARRAIDRSDRALAAWTPDVLFGLAGVYLLLRTST